VKWKAMSAQRIERSLKTGAMTTSSRWKPAVLASSCGCPLISNARWSRRAQKLHVEFVFCSRLHIVRKFGKDFPDIAREPDWDWDVVAECKVMDRS
jgi:hypothetical protein